MSEEDKTKKVAFDSFNKTMTVLRNITDMPKHASIEDAQMEARKGIQELLDYFGGMD